MRMCRCLENFCPIGTAPEEVLEHPDVDCDIVHAFVFMCSLSLILELKDLGMKLEKEMTMKGYVTV